MVRVRTIGTALAAALLTAGAVAQPGTGTKAPRPTQTPPAPAPTPTPPTPPTPTDPTGEPNQERRPPTPAPWLRQERGRNWLLSITVNLRSDNEQQRDSNGVPMTTPFRYTTMSILWPIAPATAGSEVDPDEVTGEVLVDGRSVTKETKVLPDYPGGTSLTRWDVVPADGKDGSAREVILNVQVPTTCKRTTFDDATAGRVGWPKNGWPKQAASALLPQLWVEQGLDEHGRVQAFDAAPIKEAVGRWITAAGLKDAASASPLQVAKAITAGVWSGVQMNGDGLKFSRTGELEGFDLKAPADTLRIGRGSPHDISVLLAASLRAAGLPVRTVIGWDVSGKQGNFLQNQRKQNKLRTWVEFALYDEVANEIGWVPVDLDRLRKSSSRAPRIDVAWKYFGTNPDLDYLVPLGLQFSPPTDAACYGAPALWGWFVTPQIPAQGEQRLLIRATTAPKSAETGQPGAAKPADEKKERGRAKGRG